eukprot:SAG11_NODE_4958_length_1710_cov_320.311608_4_plen_49_part_00
MCTQFIRIARFVFIRQATAQCDTTINRPRHDYEGEYDVSGRTAGQIYG